MAVFIAMRWEMICGKLSVIPDISQRGWANAASSVTVDTAVRRKIVTGPLEFL